MTEVGLERRRGRRGRDIVDHPPKSHDDVINAVAGAIQLVVPRAATAQYIDLKNLPPQKPNPEEAPPPPTPNPIMQQIVDRIP